MENKKYFVVGIDVGGTNTGKQLFFNIFKFVLRCCDFGIPI